MFLLFLLYNLLSCFYYFFFFNDTATTEIYTLSLHDALPIYLPSFGFDVTVLTGPGATGSRWSPADSALEHRSEEHTSELQSQSNLVCRLLLEKKKNSNFIPYLFPVSSLPSATLTTTDSETRA